MNHLFRNHGQKLLALALSANLATLLVVGSGDMKTVAEWRWLDILGEGGTAILVLCWLGLILSSRPAGRVTNFLTLGLSAIFLSLWVDALDEFIRLPVGMEWDHWLESAPMPIGWLLITAGLYHWRKEQEAINRHMRKRERLFREHRHFDTLTPLADAAYLRKQIELELKRYADTAQTFSLVVVDLDAFSRLNRAHGHAEGDRVLQSVSQLLLMNLRHGDLLCRFAGDRFVALLPGTGEFMARTIAGQLEESVRHYAHKSLPQGETLRLSATAAVCMARPGETPGGLLERLQLALAHAKDRSPRLTRRA